jgi:hypothetical protein
VQQRQFKGLAKMPAGALSTLPASYKSIPPVPANNHEHVRPFLLIDLGLTAR